MTTREITALAKQLAPLVAQEIRKLDDQREQEQWLSAQEAANYLGITVSTLYNLRNKIGAEKRGKKIFLKKRSLDMYKAGFN